jgi:hypothetical protein
VSPNRASRLILVASAPHIYFRFIFAFVNRLCTGALADRRVARPDARAVAAERVPAAHREPLEASRGWRLAKEKASHKIDVVVALAQAPLWRRAPGAGLSGVRVHVRRGAARLGTGRQRGGSFFDGVRARSPAMSAMRERTCRRIGTHQVGLLGEFLTRFRYSIIKTTSILSFPF